MELSENIAPITLYTIAFFAIFINGVISIPSSQIIYLTLGYLASTDKINILVAILIGTIANTLGNIVLYSVFYRNSRTLRPMLLSIFKMSDENIANYAEKFKNNWWGILILAKITPSIKVIVPIVCAIIKMHFFKSYSVFLIGSFLWSVLLLSFGYYLGKETSLYGFYAFVFFVYLAFATFSYFKAENKEKIPEMHSKI